MQEKKISDNVIRRLPRYLRKLEELQTKGKRKVSSFELGDMLGLSPSQIRQDLNCFGDFGLQGYGYGVPALRACIMEILGMQRGHRALLVGVGNIGRALIDKFSFEDWGFCLESTFDADQEIIGRVINGIPVRDVRTLPNYLRNNPTDVAVLCVPKSAAEETTALLRRGGVKAIWNFTNVEIERYADGMLVENVLFSDSLLTLSYYLSRQETQP